MVAIAIVSCLLLHLFIAAKYGSDTYRILGFVALVGHFVVALVILPVLPYGWDIGNFHDVAITTLSGQLGSASTTVTSFGTVQSVIYAIFGSDPTNLSVINGLFGVLIPIPAVYIANKLYGDDLRFTDGLTALILFLPLPFLFLTIPMRDSLTVLLAFINLAVITHTVVEEDAVFGLTVIPLIALLYPLRRELAMILLLGACAGTGILLLEKLELDISLPTLTGLLGFIGAVGFVLFAEVMYSLDSANAQLAYRASGGAVYLDGMQYESWLDFLLMAPGRAIYFQFAPFPLHVESMFHALAFVTTVYIIVLVVAAARSVYTYETNQVVLVTLLVVYLAGITGYGLINSNFGTNVRHRIPFVFLLVIFAAPVIQRWELWVRQWLGVGPHEDDQHDGEHQKAHEFDGDVQPGD